MQISSNGSAVYNNGSQNPGREGTLDSEFWAAIAGSIVGGAIAAGIQYFATRAEKKRRAIEAKERRHALALSLLFKMIKIHSHLHQYHSHLEESFRRGQSDPEKPEPWQFVLPIANNFEPVHFSTDEMTMLLSLKNDNLFNDMVSMDEVHNSTLILFDTFKALRTELTSQLSTRMNGTVGSAAMTKDQFLQLRPKMVELNGLLNDLRARCELDAREARNNLTRLHAELVDKVGITFKFEFKPGMEMKSPASTGDKS